jgi:oligopeptide/dipeptide ABC transporter ATP-binding protein
MLRIHDLTVSFGTPPTLLPVVRGVDLAVGEGEILGLVGESGSGKSLTCLSIMQLLGPNAVLKGRIEFKGQDLLELDEAGITRMRGREIAMIFQDAMGSLNPVQTIGKQLREALRLDAASADGATLNGERSKTESIRLLGEVGIPEPRQRLREYPHQLSGGMNQRALIAMMLARNPSLLIADEPTTALDVTIQAQILRLLKGLRDHRGMSIILVTHDLGVVAETCDRVAVMYCGRVVETGTVEEVFKAPRHPYTIGLLNSRPRIDREVKELQPIEGVVPSPSAMPSGCAFRPRCPRAAEVCSRAQPNFEFDTMGHGLMCFHPSTDSAERSG